MAKNAEFSGYDAEMLKRIDDILPERIFDAHTHAEGLADYEAHMRSWFGPRRSLRINMFPMPRAEMADPVSGRAAAPLAAAMERLRRHLEAAPDCVGELLTAPGDTAEELEAGFLAAGGPGRIVGVKPYHLPAVKKPTDQADVEAYLPEAALELAEKYRLAVTLHLVKDGALADPANLRAIRRMARAFPNAKLVLAHAGRSFAAWTGLEGIPQTADLDNVFFDFSAVCEVPALLMALRKAGLSRCMWGSDYPVALLAGRAISLGSGFAWLGEKALAAMGSAGETACLVGTENLQAMWQLVRLEELGPSDREALFYGNACRVLLGE